MRWMMTLVLGVALAMSGCGDDDSGDGGSAGSGGAAGSGGSAGAGGTAGSGGQGGEGGAGGTSGGEAPVITMVAWAPEGTCSLGSTGSYTVTVTATDADSPAGDLVYDGSVLGCTGEIDAASSSVTCPNAAPYNGMVVVEDGDGNVSVPASFTIGVCESSSVTP